MSEEKQETEPRNLRDKRAARLIWAGVMVASLVALVLGITTGSGWTGLSVALAVWFVALLAAFVLGLRERRRLDERAHAAEQEAAHLRTQLEVVRSQTAQLRENLQADNREAKRANLLVLLGQFTAGFMHEFNNPLAIVAGRLEVLLEERKNDEALCADLNQMLHETRYMSDIAKTMLQALRRDRGVEMFEAAHPQKAVEEAIAALRPAIDAQDVKLVVEFPETPKVDVPEHVIGEVTRGMLNNALKAVRGKTDGTIWVRLEPSFGPNGRVVLRIEDNGPGVPEQVRPHLFEPFVSQNLGRETLGMGLGLFLAASLLDMYDGRIRYENREGGGASFMLELPAARFDKARPYGIFAGEISA